MRVGRLKTLIFLHDRIEFDELALMALPVVDEIGKLPADGVYVVEPRQSHIAVEVGGCWTWMCSSREPTTISQPLRPRCLAIPNPMPLLAPVIKAIFSPISFYLTDVPLYRQPHH